MCTALYHGAVILNNESYYLRIYSFPNPTKFVPERWLRGSPAHHQAQSYANVTFGHGPRMCVGRRFAELELYLLVIKTLQRFRMEYHHQALDIAASFTNKPDKKVKIRFIKR